MAPTKEVKFIGAVDDAWQMFSDDPDDYEIGLPIGFGATSIVYACRYLPKKDSPDSSKGDEDGIPCAVKVVDLDKLPPASLRLLRRETQLMSLSKHPNLLRVRGSWMAGHKLYIALRLMNAGSAADVMHYGWPGGMEEEVVKCILKQALEGLNYLHVNGFIHRDVKAANMLIDDDGTVLLGDLGVAASLSDEEPLPTPSGSGQMNFEKMFGVDSAKMPMAGPSNKKVGKRKSFVGTPCWMAPELISGKQYDAKADIWSFGITAIELTQGRAPRSREAPSRVLLKTVQEAAPEFLRESSRFKFSKQFKEIVESCLEKDPAKRPTADELLETSFFKGAKRKSYLVNAILKDLPPLIHRQERRIIPGQHPLNAPSRTSMSSWDFTLELPHTPTGHAKRLSHGSAHSTYFGHHSLHPTLHTSSRLHALEENAYADAFARAADAAQQRDEELNNSNASTDHEDDVEQSHSSSAESSVFDLSDATTPEVAPSSVGASSTVTTPLSCSPAKTLDNPINVHIPPLFSSQKREFLPPISTTSDTTSPSASSRPNDEEKTPREPPQLDKSLEHRRGSSPTSSVSRANITALRRITSATASTSLKSSSDNPSALRSANKKVSASSPTSTPTSGTSTPKESRWKRLMRSGSVPKMNTPAVVGGGDGESSSGTSSSPPGVLGNGDRRKSTLGRILEKTGR